MRFFLHQIAQRLEIEAFVFSARDQNHRFGLRLQRFFRRIQIRGFGIVNVCLRIRYPIPAIGTIIFMLSIVYLIHVCPKPPAPLTVSSNVSTCSQSTFE